MEAIKILDIVFHLEGKLKGFYTVEFVGDNKPLMKSKTKSALLAKLSKFYKKCLRY